MLPFSHDYPLGCHNKIGVISLASRSRISLVEYGKREQLSSTRCQGPPTPENVFPMPYMDIINPCMVKSMD